MWKIWYTNVIWKLRMISNAESVKVWKNTITVVVFDIMITASMGNPIRQNARWSKLSVESIYTHFITGLQSHLQAIHWLAVSLAVQRLFGGHVSRNTIVIFIRYLKFRSVSFVCHCGYNTVLNWTTPTESQVKIYLLLTCIVWRNVWLEFCNARI